MAKKGDKDKARDKQQAQPPPSDEPASGDDGAGTATLAGTAPGDVALRASDQGTQPTLAATLDTGLPDKTVVEARLDQLHPFDKAEAERNLAKYAGDPNALTDLTGKAITRHDGPGVADMYKQGKTYDIGDRGVDQYLQSLDPHGSSATGIAPAEGHQEKAPGDQTGSGGVKESDSATGSSGGGAKDGGASFGQGHMASLSNLPPGVELNDNAPHPEWYQDDNLKGLLPNQFGGGDDKKFKPADAKDFKEKSDKASGSNDAAYKEWLKKTSPDGGTKMSDPDAAGGTGGAVPTVLDGPPPDPGAGISHTVNPQDDLPSGPDPDGFDPKADPHDPYVLRDPDAAGGTGGAVPTVLDGPPPDPGAGISHPVNPQDDLGGQFAPQTGGGGTQGNPQVQGGEAAFGDASVDASVEVAAHASAPAALDNDASSPQIAAGNDFDSQAPDAPGPDDPGAVPGGIDDDDGP